MSLDRAAYGSWILAFLVPWRQPPSSKGRTRLRHAQGRSADFQSAVSPTCSRHGADVAVRVWLPAAAGYKPAIQQSSTLRYFGGLDAALGGRAAGLFQPRNS